MTTAWIYRADLTGLSNAGAATVFRYATTAYRTSPTHPTLPNTWIGARLKQPLLLRRDLYGQQRTHGDAQLAHGSAELLNPDGELDPLLGYGFDGQAIALYRIDPASPDTEILEFSGQMETFTSDGDVMTITVRDATYSFDVALQPTKYAGSNSLPNGLEGTADDIKGAPKPICYGVNYNIEPVPVNTSRLVYQFHDAALWAGAGVTLAFYDKRIALGTGTQRPIADIQAGASSATVSAIDTATDIISTGAAHGFSTADPVHVDATTTVPSGLSNTQYYFARVLSATTFTLHPTAADATSNTNRVDITSGGAGTITVAKNRTPLGRYDWCSDSSGSFIRLGSLPLGAVTGDVTNPVSGSGGAASNSWQYILAAVLARFGSYTVDNRIATGAYGDIGVYWRDETTVYAAIREILQSMNGSFQLYPNRTSGTYVTTQRLESPSGTPVLSLDTTTIKEGSLKLLQSQSEERGIPPWRINCNYKRNRKVMTGTDVGGATAADAASVQREYRVTQYDNSAAKLRYPLAPELTVDTYLTDETGAQLHATYLHDTIGITDRLMVGCTISMDLTDPLLTNVPAAPEIPGLMVGQVVQVTYPRFGFDSGKLMAVLGYVLDYQTRMVDLILWG